MNIETLISKYNENPYDITTVSLLYHELKETNDARAEEFKAWLDKLVQGNRAQSNLDEVRFLDEEVSAEEQLKKQILRLQKRDLVAKASRKTYSDRNRSTFIILALLLGFLGVHNFYIKRYSYGFFQLFFYSLLACTGIGLVLVYILLGLEMVYTKTDGEGKNLY